VRLRRHHDSAQRNRVSTAPFPVVRVPGSIVDRTFEFAFLAPSVEAYVFTFG
jgi:hypothetical protein